MFVLNRIQLFVHYCTNSIQITKSYMFASILQFSARELLLLVQFCEQSLLEPKSLHNACDILSQPLKLDQRKR